MQIRAPQLLAGTCRGRPAGPAQGAISCINKLGEPLAVELLWICMILQLPWQVYCSHNWRGNRVPMA